MLRNKVVVAERLENAMKRGGQRAGWTLLEVMIVTTIIGIMALIAIPTWQRAKDRTVRELCRRNQNMIFEQMNIYCLEHNKRCTVTTFTDMNAVKDALVPEDGSAKYIKRRNVFTCPGNSNQESEDDYRMVLDGYDITGIECDYNEEHND